MTNRNRTKTKPKRADVLWRPHAGPQARALSSPAYELLFGGSAGGGKSEFLLMGALRFITVPSYRAILFRRTFKELEASLVSKSWEYYPQLGARYSGQRHAWTFPSGARVLFSHLEHEHDVHQHQSAEYQYLGFDELPSFEEAQYRYLLSRGRSAVGLPILARAAANPDPGWVKRRWAPWVDRSPDYDGPRAESGDVLWYAVDELGVEHWVGRRAPGALSRSFIRSRLTDNPTLMAKDPDYGKRLGGLDPVMRARLRDGDWSAVYAAGKMFKRTWFEVVDEVPRRAARVRFWDRAATEEGEGTDPDWTVGVLYAAADGLFYVEDVKRVRGRPREVEQLILDTAADDAAKYSNEVLVALSRDPGSAGEYEAEQYLQKLAKYPARSDRETGSKIVRAGPVSSQAEARNVRVKRARWNETFFAELEAFPDGEHDDQVDGLAGAHRTVIGWGGPMVQETEERPGIRELGGY